MLINNLFKENYPQGNIYVGTKFNDCFGVELGYEATNQRDRTASTVSGDPYLGQVVPLGVNFTTETKSKIKGFHANLVGFWPIWEEYCVSLIGSLGVANLKLDATHVQTTLNGAPNPNIAQTFLKFSKEKWVPRAMIGAQYMIMDQLGLRATVNWENTSKFNKIAPKNNAVSILRASTENSINLGLGLFFNFK